MRGSGASVQELTKAALLCVQSIRERERDDDHRHGNNSHNDPRDVQSAMGLRAPAPCCNGIYPQANDSPENVVPQVRNVRAPNSRDELDHLKAHCGRDYREELLSERLASREHRDVNADGNRYHGVLDNLAQMKLSRIGEKSGEWNHINFSPRR